MQKFCQNCQQATIHTQKGGAMHLLHFGLTLLTGFWAIVWIYCAVSATKRDECCVCGCAN